MAFKKARGCNYKEKMIIDETTEEILDYLLRSRNFLSDLTLLKLNQKVKLSFSMKIYEFFEGFLKPSKISSSKSSLIIFLSILSLAGNFSNNTVFAVTNNMKQQIIDINQNNNRLIPLNSNESSANSKNNIVPVSEEFKDNMFGVKPGQPLMIIPQNAKVHIVKKGENLIKISNIYNVSLKKLISVNPKIDLLNLNAGEKLIIPDIKTVRDHRYRLASRGFSPSIGFSQDRYFKWPTQGKEIISRFGFRGFRNHSGVDISGRVGDPILASKSGTVVFSGWSGEYGKCVIIDHGSGVQTLYAHASQLLVKVGNSVYAGQQIAKVGTTGNASCSHLHFQVMLNGTPKNPAKYLKS